MIVDLPSSTTTEVSKRLIALRHSVGAMAMGRVLTLLIVTDEALADEALEVANDATRQHPARILAVVRANRRGASRLDAQIRVGGDAGASEIVVLRLYGEMADHGASVVTPLLLPDSPIVAWWPGEPPSNVAGSALGSIAHRRITDAGACAAPATQLRRRAKHYSPGDTDLAWTRVTRWRGLLAAALDEPPFSQIRSAVVVAEPDEPSADLIAAWLAQALDVPVQRVASEVGTGIVSVRMDRENGPIELVRADAGLSTLAQPGRPVREVALRIPDAAECLADELRRLDADEIYAAALTGGLRKVTRVTGEQQDRTDEPVTTTGEERELMTTGTVRVSSDSETLAADVAAGVAEAIEEAVTTRGVAHLVLTGGSMGARTVTALADRDLPAEVWSKVHIWWGDERFVPEGHEDRNDQQARDAGLDRIPVPAEQVHSTPAGSSEEELPAAADQWTADLAAQASDGDPAPRFDVMILGMGPDTHVASLFPGRAELEVTDRVVVPVTESPKPPPLRLTLTVPAINASERVWFVVSGADKAEAVATARATQDDPQVPASWVRGTRETVWWLDRAAAHS